MKSPTKDQDSSVPKARPRKRPAAKSLLRNNGGHKVVASKTLTKEKMKPSVVQKPLSEMKVTSPTKTKNVKKANLKTVKKANLKTEKTAGRKSTVAKKSKTLSKAKKTTVSPVKKGSTASEPVWIGEPNEALDGGWPSGWTKKIYERQSGKSKGHLDRYWFTPQKKYKLRSMVEVKKFLKALKQTKNNDEDAAKARMASIVL